MFYEDFFEVYVLGFNFIINDVNFQIIIRFVVEFYYMNFWFIVNGGFNWLKQVRQVFYFFGNIVFFSFFFESLNE